MGSFKNYFSEIQKDITDVENTVEDEISLKRDHSDITGNKKKNE